MFHSKIRKIKSRRTKWEEKVARMGWGEKNEILVGNPEGKRPLGRPRRRWEDKLSMNLR
jgi:hypothetical protein